MIVVSMAAIHRGEILHGSLSAVARIYYSGIRGIVSDPVRTLQYRSCQGRGELPVAADKAAADRENAAGAVNEFAAQVGKDLVKLPVLEP